MKDFSQNGEQKYILNHFGPRKGRFLDIGANDGVTLSNTCALALRSWEGVYIEPSPKALEKLYANIESTFPAAGDRFQIIPKALSNQAGKVTLYENGEHLKNGDVALLSTVVESEIDRWQGTEKFEPVTVEAVTWDDLALPGPFHFVSIDAEGMDLEIMKQIDFSAMKTEMLIIEYNNVRSIEQAMIAEAEKHDLSFFYKSYENLIFVR